MNSCNPYIAQLTSLNNPWAAEIIGGEKHIHTHMIMLMKMVNPNSGAFYQQDLIIDL